MEEICKATKNFSRSLKIGEGRFGTVYKGRLKDGTLVAVKRAKKHDRPLVADFQREIQTLALVEHLNIVKFYGHLDHKDEKIVVVEHVPNGNLREHLDYVHGNALDFAVRLDVAIDVAHAVTYLHMYTDHPIIHRDINSSNILLKENLRAKVADFGFARLAANSEWGETYVSTSVKGTLGYVDPEYLRTLQLTEKSDVYSFGVLLVELVTGRCPIELKRGAEERVTVRWVMKKFYDGDAILTLDPRLQRSPANNFIVEKILEVALQCLAPHQRNRPTMKKCAEILWSIRKDFKEFPASDSLSSNA
ncbi:calmodulin-binding receptor-like cytoplasmic kinase 2 [Olea europaea var. sylvestris]|uniref:calmodulin-binding receptor-like cytoplasmic kinase 2 n=1 Tax=Olea europaea var. sylvestris TaxID=158386 RepID=UPI000C1D8851|nr:calmodulin-binding receptor-like cytoplasmic kinase 2 [Olea europaea var. sylvestris]